MAEVEVLTKPSVEQIISKIQSYKSSPPMKIRLEELTTPAAIVDLKKFQSNCDGMLETTRKFGVRKLTLLKVNLRGMIKTHKTIEGALFQLFGTEGVQNLNVDTLHKSAQIVVSTLTDAEFYSKHGFKDILYPYPPSIDKLQRALKLQQSGTNICLSVDNMHVLDNLLSFSKEHNTNFRVYLDLDQEHRSGIDPKDPSSITIAKKIAESKHLSLYGLYVHAGQSYGSKNSSQIKEVAEQEIDSILMFKRKLHENGIEVPVTAIGSTPTVVQHSDSLSGVNEVHPGNYTLFDTFQATIGTCSFEKCALTILTRVISHYTFPHNRLLIDAGAFALSKDKGPVHVDNYNQYGVIVNHPELRIVSISQEVAIVESAKGLSFALEDFPVGTLLHIIPNHSCMSCYCYEKLSIVDGGIVIDQWKTCPRHHST